MFVKQGLRDGVDCPCCGQYCKITKRRLYNAMASALVLMYKHFRKYPFLPYIHLGDFLALQKNSKYAGGDPAKLVHWGFIERIDGVRVDGCKRTGHYKITDLGRQFVEGKIQTSKAIYTFNNQVIAYDDEWTTIEQALGDRFDYTELMRA